MIKRNILNNKYIIFIIILLLYASIIRTHNISERTFDFYDEGWYTASAGSAIVAANYMYSHFYEIVNGNFDPVELRKTVKQNSPVIFGVSGKPAFYTVLLLGLLLGGFNQFSLFFEMVIISLITVYIIFATANHLFDQRVGLFATFFSVFSGIMVFFSRLAMPQMLMVMWCMLAFYSSFRIREGTWAIVFGISSAFAFFTHPACGLILISIWIYVTVSLYIKRMKTDKNVIFRIILSSALLSFIFILMAQLPQLLFKSQINNPTNYLEPVLHRGINQGIATGLFSSISEIPFLLQHIWESEFISIFFVIVGSALIILKNRQLNQTMVILIPLCYTFLYFFIGISYRFRMFILIYPFLNILAGLGFVFIYDFLLSKNNFPRLGLFIKGVFCSVIIAIMINSINLSLSSENSNKYSFQRISSGLDHYLENLPSGESREVSIYQGHLGPWFYYYFAKDRIKKYYPNLAKSIIWDWSRERPKKESYGDIIIILEGDELSDKINKEITDELIGKRKPILRAPFSKNKRNDYLGSTFERKETFLNVYDLKNN